VVNLSHVEKCNYDFQPIYVK